MVSSSQFKAHIYPTSPRHTEDKRPNGISKGHFISEMSTTSTNDSPFHIGITGIYQCTNLPTHKSCASLIQTPSVVQTIVVGSIVALYFSSQENEHRSPMCLRQSGVR